MAQQGYGSPMAQNQNSILDDCIDIQNQAHGLENKLGVLNGLQKRYLDDADTSGGSSTKRDLDNLTQSMMDQYRALTDRIRAVKRTPESRERRNQSQVDKTDRDVRRAIQRFQEMESVSRKEIEERAKRQARIAHPDASEAEIRQIVESDTQVFAQAVMGSNRTENATRALGAHKERRREMELVERQLLELIEILSETQELLVKQEEVIQTVDTQMADTKDQMVAANVDLKEATSKALSARSKKWWCLGICVLIVVIIVVIVVVYMLIVRGGGGGGGGGGNNDNNNNNNNNNGNNNADTTGGTTGDTTGQTTGDNTAAQRRSPFQRNVLDDLQMNTGRAAKISPDVVPRSLKRLSIGARRAGAAANQEVEALTKKRFVVDWQGAEPTGSDD